MIISVINSKECFGYEPIKNMKPSTEYDETKDLVFYHEPLQAGTVIHSCAERNRIMSSAKALKVLPGEECKIAIINRRSIHHEIYAGK